MTTNNSSVDNDGTDDASLDPTSHEDSYDPDFPRNASVEEQNQYFLNKLNGALDDGEEDDDSDDEDLDGLVELYGSPDKGEGDDPDSNVKHLPSSTARSTKKPSKSSAFGDPTTLFNDLIADPDLPMMSRNEIIEIVTQKAIAFITTGTLPSEPRLIERNMLFMTQNILEAANSMRGKNQKMSQIMTLTPVQVAQLLVKLHNVCNIATSEVSDDRSYDLIGMFSTSGDHEGLYVTSEEEIRRVARKYNYDLTIQGFKEVVSVIRDTAPRRFRCLDRDLIAVNNGIFNYKTKELEPFTQERVFLCKSRVDYNADAKNPTIYNPDDDTYWDIETWMNELSDDKGVPELLWEICGAVLRPNVAWDKAAFFYAESGSNGKGTVCTLLRNLCGPGAHASIPIADMGKDFMLEQLIGKQAIIVDENDVGMYLDKAANLKTIITQDILQINRKHKSAVSYRFQGFMVQCLNDEPKIKDKSDSLYRRQLFVPMNKKFSGSERKYIKGDYLHRKDVLEYALKKVLHTNFYKLSEPAASTAVLREYKVSNDPVREFFEEYEFKFSWDALPFKFLYDAYRAWYSHNVPSGTSISSRNFNKDIKKIIENSLVWELPSEDDDRFMSRKLMVGPEPVIAELKMTDWMNKEYKGSDLDEICKPKLEGRYRGIVRTGLAPETINAVSDDPSKDLPETSGDSDATNS